MKRNKISNIVVFVVDSFSAEGERSKVSPLGGAVVCNSNQVRSLVPSLVSEGVLAFLRCRNIDIYGVHKNVKFLRHL